MGDDAVFDFLLQVCPEARVASPYLAEGGAKFDATLDMGTMHVPHGKDDIESYGDDEFLAVKTMENLPLVLAAISNRNRADQNFPICAAKAATTKRNIEAQICVAMTWTLDDVVMAAENSTVVSIDGIAQKKINYKTLLTFVKANDVQIRHDRRQKGDVFQAIYGAIAAKPLKKAITALDGRRPAARQSIVLIFLRTTEIYTN